MFLADEWSTKKGLKLTYLLYEEHWFEPLGSLQWWFIYTFYMTLSNCECFMVFVLTISDKQAESALHVRNICQPAKQWKEIK